MGCRGSKEVKGKFRHDDDASTVTNQLSATQRRVCLPPLSDEDNDVDDAAIDLLTTKVLAEFNARQRAVRNTIHQWVDGSYDADGFPNTLVPKRRVQLLLDASVGDATGSGYNMVGGVLMGPRPQQKRGLRKAVKQGVDDVRNGDDDDDDDDESTTTTGSTHSSRGSQSTHEGETKLFHEGGGSHPLGHLRRRGNRERGWQARVGLLQQALPVGTSTSARNGGGDDRTRTGAVLATSGDGNEGNNRNRPSHVTDERKSGEHHSDPNCSSVAVGASHAPVRPTKAGVTLQVPLHNEKDASGGSPVPGVLHASCPSLAVEPSQLTRPTDGAATTGNESNQNLAPQPTPIKFTVVAKVINALSHTVMTYRKSEKVLGKGSSATVYLGSVTTVTTPPVGGVSPSASLGVPGGDSSCSGSFEAGVVTKKFMTAVKEILVSPAAVMLETPDGRRKKTTHLYKCGESLDAILAALRHEFKVLKALDGCPQVVRVLHIAITSPGTDVSAPGGSGSGLASVTLDAADPLASTATAAAAVPRASSALSTSNATAVDDGVPLPFRPQRARMFLEYVKHGTLLDEAKRILSATAPPPPPRKPHLHELTVRAYMRDVLLGLVYLHEHKVLHRDVKPHNILVHSFVEEMYDTMFPICLEDPLTTFSCYGDRDSDPLHPGNAQDAGGITSPLFVGPRRATAPGVSSSSPQPGGAAGTQDSQGGGLDGAGGGGVTHSQQHQVIADRRVGRPATVSRSASTSNAAAPPFLANSNATAGGAVVLATGRGGAGVTPSQSDAPLQPPQGDATLPRPEFLLQASEVMSSGESFCDRDTAIRETIYPCLKPVPHGNHRDKYKTLVKLTDFGSARWLIPQMGAAGGGGGGGGALTFGTSAVDAAPSYTNAAAFMMQTAGMGAKTTMNVVGTAPYLAPEAIRGKFSPASDIWSFAITFLELVLPVGEGVWDHLNARDPFQLILRIGALRSPSEGDPGAAAVAADMPRIPSHLSAECQRMLARCLSLDPLKRPSALELLQCKYFYRADWIPRALEAGRRGRPGGIEPIPEILPHSA